MLQISVIILPIISLTVHIKVMNKSFSGKTRFKRLQ